jgi:energy-coupling factor transporter transmembrane protein EcfT
VRDGAEAAFLRSARGPLARAAPRTRLCFGVGMLAAALLAPQPVGIGLAVLLAVVVLCVAGLPARQLRRILAFGVAVYAPMAVVLLAMAAVTAGGPEAGAALRAATPATLAVVVRGFAAMLIGLGTVATLRAAELQDAVATLPLPATVRLLLVQMAHQTGSLLDETGRLKQAVQVRAAGRGLGTSLRTAAGMPHVWLGRMAYRAERVGAAMEVRGYGPAALSVTPPKARCGGRDAAWLTAAALAPLAAGALHLL